MASRALKIDPKKASTTEPERPQADSAEPDQIIIEVRAYELWTQRGCPIGSPEIDWYQAEEEIRKPGSRAVPAA